MSDKREMKSPEERIEDIKTRKETYGLPRDRATQERVAGIAGQDDKDVAAKEAIVEGKGSAEKKKKKPMSIAELTNNANAYIEKVEETKKKGFDLTKPTKDKAPVKDNVKDNVKGKELGQDDNKNKENDEKKRNPELAKIQDKIKLSGLDIREENANYVLVYTDPNGKTQSLPVTDLIDKYNRDIESNNHQSKLYNEGPSGRVNDVSATSKPQDDIARPGQEAPSAPSVPPVPYAINETQEKLPELTPEQAATFAEAIVTLSNENIASSSETSKSLVEKMRERDKKNKDRGDNAYNKQQQAMLARSQEQRGGR